MNIAFEDGSTIEVDRIDKSYDVSNGDVRMVVDMASGVTPEDVIGKDFSSFSLQRTGFEDVEFEGYEVMNVTEYYESTTTNVVANLSKEYTRDS